MDSEQPCAVNAFEMPLLLGPARNAKDNGSRVVNFGGGMGTSEGLAAQLFAKIGLVSRHATFADNRRLWLRQGVLVWVAVWGC